VDRLPLLTFSRSQIIALLESEGFKMISISHAGFGGSLAPVIIFEAEKCQKE
jgi:hypothetical protein